MRMLAAAGLALGVAMMAAPLVLPRLGVLAPAQTAAPAGAGGFSPLAEARGMVAQVAAVGDLLRAPVPVAALPAGGPAQPAGAEAPAAQRAALPQVTPRRTAPAAKFVKVE